MDETYQEFNKRWLRNNRIEIDWEIAERNSSWHRTYFTRRAISDHQAKGNCRLATMAIEEMEQQGWLIKRDVILDPMCGIGSFLIVAALRNYNAVGIELEDRFYKDMVGFHEQLDVPSDDLLAGVSSSQHIEGTIEYFHKITEGTNKGKIRVIHGDARNTDEIMERVKLNSFGRLGVVCSPPYGNRLSDETQKYSGNDERTFAELEADSDGRRQYSNDPDNIGTNRIAVISSPPYSRATEIGGKSKDPDPNSYFQRMQKKTAGYSTGKATNQRFATKVGVLCSPPYSRSTEHSEDQIAALPGEKVHGHKAFMYADVANIATLKLGSYDVEMKKVYKAVYRALQSGAPVALITRNFIQKGRIVLLDELTKRLMGYAGFNYQFTRRANLPDISMFKHINWRKKHRHKNLPLITWEEVTFYLKP